MPRFGGGNSIGYITNINEWEAYGGTGILFTNSEEVLQEVYRKIEMVE